MDDREQSTTYFVQFSPCEVIAGGCVVRTLRNGSRRSAMEVIEGVDEVGGRIAVGALVSVGRKATRSHEVFFGHQSRGGSGLVGDTSPFAFKQYSCDPGVDGKAKELLSRFG